jgi:hypothetical protein
LLGGQASVESGSVLGMSLSRRKSSASSSSMVALSAGFSFSILLMKLLAVAETLVFGKEYSQTLMRS